MNKNIAITVITWNDWENTTICLESIFQSTYEHFDVILVNNGSDNSYIKKIYDWANNKIGGTFTLTGEGPSGVLPPKTVSCTPFTYNLT